jgi:drug/metabolite transporter (DMT)-like permease
VLQDRWKTWVCFGIIYLVWGSTFYAIRVGVHEMPPLLMAGARFFAAGLVLCAWALARGERLPGVAEWGAVSVMAVLIFVIDYGLLFWAEQRVASGTSAVILATIPAFMALSEIVLLGTQRLTVRLAAALAVGLAGVLVLVDPWIRVGGAPIYTLGAVGLTVAALSWSVAASLARLLPLPSSKLMSSGAQMLLGGALLGLLGAALGELHELDLRSITSGAWASLVYLTVAGSIVGFTAYTWLIQHVAPTKVGTYAYVNPLVAVLIGYYLGGEGLDGRTLIGTFCVIASVIIITTGKSRASRGALAGDARASSPDGAA